MTLAVRFIFSQNEIIANDYYVISFCEKDRNKNFTYRICDICIISFDNQMNCIKSHIYFFYKEQQWLPKIESFYGTIQHINDSTILYTDNRLNNASDDFSKALLRCARYPDPMSTIEGEIVVRSSSIKMGETLILYPLKEIPLTATERREFRKIIKLCGLRIKKHRIAYPQS